MPTEDEKKIKEFQKLQEYFKNIDLSKELNLEYDGRYIRYLQLLNDKNIILKINFGD